MVSPVIFHRPRPSGPLSRSALLDQCQGEGRSSRRTSAPFLSAVTEPLLTQLSEEALLVMTLGVTRFRGVV